MVNGQNHKGSTYHIGKMLADKLGGETTEFFLPRDFGRFCVGCTNCFMKQESLCPHFEELRPLTQAMDAADVLIFTSPVYVYHVTGPMKAFLDHYGYRWMIHRPEESMFRKQAVCISTAAGAGTKSANQDMADSFYYWGIPQIYKCGFHVRATSYERINDHIKERMERETDLLAKKILQRQGRIRPRFKTVSLFYMMRWLNKRQRNEADYIYWEEKGWIGKKRPWKPKNDRKR